MFHATDFFWDTIRISDLLRRVFFGGEWKVQIYMYMHTVVGYRPSDKVRKLHLRACHQLLSRQSSFLVRLPRTRALKIAKDRHKTPH